MIPGLFVLGLLVGSSVGGTAALLVAPERGSALRRRARARAQPAAARVRAAALGLTARIRAPPPKGDDER
jgi:gas vesicle protein